MRCVGRPGRIDAGAGVHPEEIRRFLRRPTASASDDDMLPDGGRGDGDPW
ncbi:MAG: hypothetical protein M3341_08635 [Actinomycetota bacterium]|nr:hypothetical protein [Actinomycetota bacterium]